MIARASTQNENFVKIWRCYIAIKTRIVTLRHEKSHKHKDVNSIQIDSKFLDLILLL